LRADTIGATSRQNGKSDSPHSPILDFVDMLIDFMESAFLITAIVVRKFYLLIADITDQKLRDALLAVPVSLGGDTDSAMGTRYPSHKARRISPNRIAPPAAPVMYFVTLSMNVGVAAFTLSSQTLSFAIEIVFCISAMLLKTAI
jgi:hypothetical protein